MNATSTRRVKVESGGTGVVAHVGLHALGELADTLGLGEALSSAIPWRGSGVPVHDRGKVLVHGALMLAGGGESCADIEHLRSQGVLFGAVSSDSTLFRTCHDEITEVERSGIARVLQAQREKVWGKGAQLDRGEPVILDIDASLVDVHSENKEQATPTYKRGFGFHPMFCFADATGETLSALLRPGSATANNASDHIRVLDAAVAQLSDEIARGHGDGDEASKADHTIVVRADSAGCTKEFLSACRDRNIGFFVTARANAEVEAAIFDAEGIEQVWIPALDQGGELRADTAVCELTSLIKAKHLPEGTRLIVRREALHPGAQRSLFPSLEYRYWGFYTDQEGEPEELDVIMRAHAHVESHIQRLKDSGLMRFPFTSFEANKNWIMLVALAADLVRWFQMLCLEGSWRTARPKALRWNFFHAPGRVAKSARRYVVRLLDGWPTSDVLLNAYQRIPALA